MKKIVVVGMTENPGGVETYLMNFFSSMKNEYKITFINTDANSKIAYQDSILNNGGDIFVAKNEDSLKSYFGRTKTAVRILKKIKADIVYVNALTANSAYWIKASKRLKIPAVYHSHNDSEIFTSKLKKFLSNIIKPYNQNVLRYSTQLAASESAGLFTFGDNDAITIYNSIDPQKWKFNNEYRLELRKELEISSDQKLIIIVARLSIQKNIVRAIEILKKLIDLDGSYRCIVVGDGDLRNQVVDKINELKLNDYIKLLGKRNDVNKLMSASDLLLLPSLFEGLPFVVIEAQGAGLPVVSSEGVVPEIADITGFISEVPLKESNEYWAKKILEIGTNNVTIKEEMNQKISDSFFSNDYYSKRIKNIFRNL